MEEIKNRFLRILSKYEEGMICIAAALLFALAFVAILCGEGNKGLSNLF